MHEEPRNNHISLLKTHVRRTLPRTGLALSAIVFSMPTFAQGSSESELEEIVVKGIRGSILESLQTKRDMTNVVDAITANDIGKFPDINLSEALQRVPGVTIGRSETGEGKEINVRGLGPAFSRTEINGGNGINAFDFTVLPSELFEQIIVEKSPTAKTQEGALAAVIRAETPKPFNHQGTRAILSAAAVRGENGDTTPRVFGTYSQNWDDRLGVSVSGFYANPTFESSQLSYGSWVPFRNSASADGLATLPEELLDAATPRTPAYYKYTEDRENYAGAVALQFRSSENLEWTFDALYATAEGDRADDRPDIWTSSIAPSEYTITDGVVTSAVYSDPGVQARVGTTFQDIDQEFLQGNLRLNWALNEYWTVSPGISMVRQELSRNFDLYSFAINNADMTYTVDGEVPNFSSSFTDFSTNPEDFDYNIFLFGTNREELEEEALTLDASRSFDDGPLTAFNLGLRFADRDRIASDGARTFLPGGSQTVLGQPDSSLAAVALLREFNVSGASSPGQILGMDRNALRALYHPTHAGFDDSTDWEVYDRGETSNYLVNEKTYTGYSSVDLKVDKFRLNAGLRIVRTETTAEGNQVAGGVVTPRSVDNSYTDYLPSINTTYEVIDNGLIRAAYSRTVNRPNLSDLRPAQIINSGSFTGSRGNPTLQPFRADQFDLGFEYYFHEGAVFQVIGFVKEIGTLITQESVNEIATFPDQLTGEPTTGIISFTQPVNGDEATVTGIETGFITPFYFLDGFAKDFGVIFNYTYADSEATSRSEDGSTRSTPLPGLSEHSLNAAFFYERDGIESRLAYTWRSEYLRDDNVGRQFGAERYIDDYGQLDFSISVPVVDWGELRFEALNILDDQTVEYSQLANGQTPPTNITEKETIYLLTGRVNF